MKISCMKRFFVFLCAVVVTIAAYAENAIIIGSGSGLKDSLEVTLYRWQGRIGSLVTCKPIQNGRFRLTVPVDSGLMYATLCVLNPSHPAFLGRALYLRPGAKVEIDAVDHRIKTWKVRSNVPEQESYDAFITASKDLMDHLLDENVSYSESLYYAGSKTRRDSIQKAYDNRENFRDSLELEIDKRDVGVLRDNMSADVVWWKKMNDLARNYNYNVKDKGTYPSGIKELYDSLPESLRVSSAGKKIEALIYPVTVVNIGDKVPDSVFHDLDGNTHRLSDFKGKWLLLDFWSSGCGPCIRAIPELTKFVKDHQDDIEVISLSTDPLDVWRKASVQHKMVWNNWNEGKEDLGIYCSFEPLGVPNFVFVSPEGVIKGIYLGYSDGMFESLFKLLSTPRDTKITKSDNGTMIVDYPAFVDNQTSGILDIVRIERGPDTTKVSFDMSYLPDLWITISPQSYLFTPDGQRYKLTGSEGIIPGEEYYTDKDGKGSFTLMFEPLPEHATEIGFKEGDESHWLITGVKLR